MWRGPPRISMNPVETTLAFLNAINQNDADKVAGLMTQDHVFIDALGNSIRGREKMRAGWRAYFAMCPDYKVSHEDIFPHGNTVAAFGSAGGTISVNGQLFPENKWQTPAAWRVVVQDGLVKEFRVYADNKPVYDILAKTAKPAAP
jgi:ketosteroid isomerase-like protein